MSFYCVAHCLLRGVHFYIDVSALNGKLEYDICGALLSEEICRNSMIASHNGDAYNVYEDSYCRKH